MLIRSAANRLEIHPDVQYWLDQWARWQRRDDPGLGYPAKSSPFVTGGESQRADDWLDGENEKIDARNCAIMDTLIEELPFTQKQAIKQLYGVTRVSVYRFNQLESLLEQASMYLLPRMNDKNVL